MISRTYRRFASLISMVAAFLFTGSASASSRPSTVEDPSLRSQTEDASTTSQLPEAESIIKVKPRMVAPDRSAGVPTDIELPVEQDTSLKVKQRKVHPDRPAPDQIEGELPVEQDSSLKVLHRKVFPDRPAPDQTVIRVIGPEQMEAFPLEQFLPVIEDQRRFIEWAAGRNLKVITSDDLLLFRLESISQKLDELEERLNR